jgi:MFS family permease
VTQLAFGFLSDHAWSRLGRRRPFIINGLLFGLVSIVVLVYAPTYAWLLVAYLFLEWSLNMMAVSFQSLLPDLVPREQHSQAGSQMGIWDLGGNLIGIIVLGAMVIVFPGNEDAGFTRFLLPAYVGVLVVTGLITILGIDEIGWQQHATERLSGAMRELRILPGTVVRYAQDKGPVLLAIIRGYLGIDLRQHPNFLWLGVSRLVIYFSYQTFTSNVSKYVEYNLDQQAFLVSLGLHAADAEKYKSLVFPALIVPFILSGVIGAMLSSALARRFGKKWVITAGILVTSVMSIPLIFAHNAWHAIAAGAILGLGWGAFLATDWAYACEQMPQGQAGTFMGLWALTNLLPQVLAPVAVSAIGQSIISRGGTAAWPLANQWIFASMLAYFLLGLWLLRFVQPDRPATNTAIP